VATYNGSDSLDDIATRIDAHGCLIVVGRSRLKTISTNYTLDIVILHYDVNGALEWSATYNGPHNSEDIPTAIAIDINCGVHITGYSNDYNGNVNFVTLKYDSLGVQQWVKTYPSGNFYLSGISDLKLDNNGNTYITGSSKGALNFDCITIKYNSNGDEEWVKRFSSTPSNYTASYGFALSIDNDNNIYTTGLDNGRAFIIKYNAAGVLQWLAKDSTNNIRPSNIAVDNLGHVTITGNSQQPATQNVLTLQYDAITGKIIWAAKHLSSNIRNFKAAPLRIDNFGNTYIATTIQNSDLNYSDILIIKYNILGKEEWAEVFNGAINNQNHNADFIHDLTIDTENNIYLTGYTYNNDFQGMDYITIKYNNQGYKQWHITYNGLANDADIATAITLDVDNNIYVTGTTLNSYRTNWDITTIKYSQRDIIASANEICTGNTITFSNIASMDTIIGYEWIFAGGTPATSTAKNPVVSYDSTGKFDVSLSLTTATGTYNINKPHYISVANTATIQALGDTVFCAGNTITLQANKGRSYIWSTGDSTQSINISQSGTYSVTVLNPNGCVGTFTSEPISVNVNPLPLATITPSGDTTFCEGNSVTLRGNTASSYLWNTGDTTQSINVTTAGSYNLNTSNDAHCKNTSNTITITVNPLQIAQVTAMGSTTICEGSYLTLAASPASNYLWNTGETTQYITVNTAGDYNVTITDATGCSPTAISNIITVSLLPVQSISIAASKMVLCENDVLTLSADSINNTNFLWYPSGEITPSINITYPGYYFLKTKNDNGCESFASLYINRAYPPFVSINASSSSFCQQGNPIYLYANTMYNNNLLWSNGETNRFITITDTGTYSLTAINPEGCSATASIFISGSETATIVANKSNLCLGDTVILSAIVDSLATYNYYWSNGENTPSIAITTAGEYRLWLYNTQTNCSLAPQPLVVNSVEVPMLTIEGDTTIIAGTPTTLTANGATSYLWNIGDTIASITISPINTTTYSVVGTNNGCSSTATVTVIVKSISAWQPQIAPTTAWLQDIACTDANTCFAVGWRGTIIKTTDGGTHWEALNTGTKKYLTSIAVINQNTLIAAGDSGIFLKTIDGGNTWNPSYCIGAMEVSSICVVNDTALYLTGSGGGQVQKSNDAGLTWEWLETRLHENISDIYFTDKNIGYACGGNGTIIKTFDGGVKWEKLYSGTNIPLNAINFTNTTTGFALGSNGLILKTIDAGNTWTSINTNIAKTLMDIHFIDT